MRGARSLVALLLLGALNRVASRDPSPGPQPDPLLRAMRQELSRAMSSLQLEQMDKPYFVEYAVDDLETLDVGASFGMLLGSRHERSRPLRVDVRVGSYEQDSSEFLGRQSQSWGFASSLVLEDDVIALRHDLWYLTDAAYKKALEQIAQKRAALRNKVQTEKVPDFAQAEPQRFLGPVPTLALDVAKGEGVARRLSAIFREYPAIQESRVIVHALRGSRYLVNSEGTEIRQPLRLASLVASASTQAPDGMRLWHYVPFHAPDTAGLPSEQALAAAVRGMADELTALAAAPVLDEYVGPVLFTGPAAAEVFAQVLAPELSGQRPPLAEDERLASRLPQTRLAERLGRKVLPPFLHVVDDPTSSEFAGRPLLGWYRFDDQGVPAKAVSLLDGGVLKSFVMSRRPRKEIPASNGHGRAAAGSSPVASVSNLIIRASPGKTLDELKEDLLESCRVQGMEFGLRIAHPDVSFFSGRDEAGGGRGAQDSISRPVLAYKVYVADGREELVRGLVVGELTLRTLKDITAAGSEPFVWTRPFAPRGAGASGLGALGTESLPVTIVTPSVLFDELELKRAEGPQEKPVLLPHPAF